MSQPQNPSIKALNESHLSSLLALLERNSRTRSSLMSTLGFDLSRDLLEARTLGDPDFESGLFLGAFSGADLVGCIMGVRRPWKQGRKHDGWIKFIVVDESPRRQGIGQMLLQRAEKQFKGAGVRRLTFGSSAPNYLFPGVPQEDTGLTAFLAASGWERTSARTNLHTSLLSPTVDEEHLRSRMNRRPEIDVAAATPGDRDEVETFIEQTFSRSWMLEVAPAFESHEQGHDAILSVARVSDPTTSKSPIVGFAAVNCTNPGWLGPMGVTKAQRKKGVGALLLLHCLLRAKSAGHDTITIPWVSEDNATFYTKIVDADVRGRFWKMVKMLG